MTMALLLGGVSAYLLLLFNAIEAVRDWQPQSANVEPTELVWHLPPDDPPQTTSYPRMSVYPHHGGTATQLASGSRNRFVDAGGGGAVVLVPATENFSYIRASEL